MSNNSMALRIAERFSSLNIEQQRAVYQKVRQEGMSLGQFPILPRVEALQSSCLASYAQTRQWFLWQLEPDSSAYHISGALRLTGALDVAQLEQCFAALVARHESLHTVFRANEAGQVEQVITADYDVNLHYIDVAQRTTGAHDQTLQQVTQGEVQRLQQQPFDLETGPLLRIGLIKQAEQDHVLVVVMHHIISDGWSLQVIVNEFVTQYHAKLQAMPASFAALPLQYADYSVWQQQWLEAGEKARQLDYWVQQLGDEHPALQLPIDHVRKAEVHYVAAHYELKLPADFMDPLRRLARAEDATLFMVLLAGFQVLLQRYTGQQDIRVGVPIANRHRVETEGVVGFFVNTQVLRSCLDSRTSLKEVLAQVRQAALGAQNHQDLPFEQLVEALQPERNMGVNPLFQVMYNHQRKDQQALESLPKLTIERYPLAEQSAQFDLTLDSVESTDGQVRLVFSYAKELFECATIERMAGHYQTVLEALLHQPDQSIADIDLLNDSEQAQLTHWSVNPVHYANIEPVHRLFEQQVELQPDNTALIFDNQSLSYAELNHRANQLAQYLMAQGVQPETKVAIAIERSFDMVVGLLGILKAGAAYVPLDPDYPAERLAYIIADSGVQLLLTHSSLVDQLALNQTSSQDKVQVLRLDQMDVADYDDGNPDIAVHADNLAYVIYTSGSTGRPKGAAIAHRSLASCMTWMQHKYALTRSDTVLHKAPFGFDVSVWEIFWPLTSGVRLVVANPGDQRDPERITQLIRQHQVTTLNFVPAMLQAFLAHEGIEQETHLRYVICGGEAMPAATQAEALRRLQGVSLQNLYGPTETTIHVTQWTCRDDGKTLVPIGRPISETSAYILDDGLNAVPQGVAGELYIGGALLSRGYLHRADLTAERFVAHPFDDLGGRLYRTGDLVRWNLDGQLEYLGRIDHQVKIRGLRIELGEVEAQLLAQEHVKEAVVVALDSPSGSKLVGYVSADSQVLDAHQLREGLAQTLPDYMVPSAMVILDSLPLNANGKVDRKALPEPEFPSSSDYQAPQGELEQSLAGIWGELLDIDQVGRHDNFFELGGHSLLALKVQEKLRQLDWHVGVKTLFQHPQLADFAAALHSESGHDAVVVPANRIPANCQHIEPDMLTLIDLSPADIHNIEQQTLGGAANIQDIYPLAPLQEGILFHHLMQNDGDVYVTSHLLAFTERDSLESFIRCFNQVVTRHDVLRTAVLWEGLSEPVQVVVRHAELSVHWLASDTTASLSAREQLEQVAKAGHYRIDVRQPLMVEAVAMYDPDHERYLLQLLSHHLIFDHTTLELLINEISHFQAGTEHLLAEPVPFRNMVAQAKLGVSRAQHEQFFTAMLGDISEPTMPFALSDTHGDGKSIAESKLTVEHDLAQQLRQQAKKQGVSVTALFHLAWGMLVAKASQRQDVVFGTVLFGRMQSVAGASSAMGLSMNTLPFRVTLTGLDVCQAVKQTQGLLTEVLHHEYATLSLAHSCSSIDSGAPLFSALLNYRHSSRPNQSHTDWHSVSLLSGEERTNYPISMSVDDFGTDFQLIAQVCGGVQAADICAYMHQALAGLVAALDHAPNTRVTDIELLNKTTLARLLEWGTHDSLLAGHQPLSAFDPVHTLFAQQADQQAHNTAILFNDRQISYAELDAKSNRLAHYLLNLGITRENRIALALERSPDMLVALLAILKAGATYVALDPHYPSERLTYILRDSAAKLLLTQSGALQGVPLPQDCVELDIDAIALESESSQQPKVILTEDNLAYILYTSGSTGRPKGVQVSHGALSNFLVGMSDILAMSAHDRLVAATSLSFDISALELYLPLLCGAQVVLADRQTTMDGYLLADLIRRSNANVFQATPSGWRMVLDSGVLDVSQTNMKGICGGEALPTDVAERLLEQGIQLWNLYGPTETTVWSTAAQVSDTKVNIGRPIARTSVHILDHDLNYCLPGVAGELCIGGAGLARGYLNQAAQTAQSFIAAPLSADGERLYRTGDLVRWSDTGQLQYLGRIDHQVKIRGFRIELAEIETQLSQLESVKHAAVVVHNELIGDYLVAYIVPADLVSTDSVSTDSVSTDSVSANSEPDDAEQRHWEDLRTALKEQLAKRLPSYMMPDLMVRLDKMPLTPNGKLDRKALPKPSFTGASLYETPQGPLETAVAGIWQALLGESSIGRHDNFFELGGHSLLAMKMINQIQSMRLFKRSLRLYDFMVAPTIALLCAHEKDDHAVGISAALNQTVSDTQPLFCIHSGLGTTMGYLPLAKRLEGYRSVIGISCRVLSDPQAQAAAASLEMMADDYVAAIRSIQAAGPYHLLGWSLGGTLAAMIAARLEASGARVAFLGMVDMYVQESEHQVANECLECFEHFLASVSMVQPAPAALSLLATLDDPFAQEASLIELMQQLLTNGELVLREAYQEASAAEIVRLFLANFSIRLASAASLAPLTPVASAAHCWWVANREDIVPAIKRLDETLACDMQHAYVHDTHAGIIENSAVLDSILAALSPSSPSIENVKEALAGE